MDKKTYKCPKCGSDKILGIKGTPVHRLLAAENFPNYLHVDTGEYYEKQTFVCCDCGYSEEWINEIFLDDLKNYIGTENDILSEEEQ